MSKKTLIESVSGIRGIVGAGLDASVLVRYAAAFGTWARLRATARGADATVVVGRDARVSGPICAQIVIGALRSVGCHVINTGLASTPTVAMGVLLSEAAGGIVLTASHNPEEWNALKLLNEKSEFLSPDEGREVIGMARRGEATPVTINELGSCNRHDFLDAHIDRILALAFCAPPVIAARNFRIVVDGINSVGGTALPRLLERLGVSAEQILVINGEPTGRFAHPAEPLPEHLTQTAAFVAESKADLGLVVDPDADRLVCIDDHGEVVSEELTQVMAADFLWRRMPGPFATNLSSSRAIDDVAARYGMEVHRSAVGEIHVVRKMQETGAILGGEGNGGVILPSLHYGRDALAGAAMILQHIAEQQAPLSVLRRELPAYVIVKKKLPVGEMDPDVLLARFARRHAGEDLTTVDGVKLNLPRGWVHVRKSNTEPVLRVFAEAAAQDAAHALATRHMAELTALADS